MRVIAELPHPEFKITIMSMNQKFIVKMEKGTLEQTYKIPEMDLTEGVNSVFEILDDAFLKLIADRFNQMQRDYLDAYYRYNY